MNTTLINKINQSIRSNRCREITAPVLNSVLKDMVNKQVAEVTYAELATFIADQKVTPGLIYKITDRGDLGIWVTGLTKDTISKEGIRLMLCPATYATTGDWIGIWAAGKTASVGKKAIWGGKVWRNLTGSMGTISSQISLDAPNWELIGKDTFTDNEYIPMQFGVSYDFENDWIERQWDGAGNVFGVSYNENVFWEYDSFNPCDISDWNLGTHPDVLLAENRCVGVWNNSNGSYICYNDCLMGAIRTNSDAGSISQNNLTHSIVGNLNTGNIESNAGSSITFNSNVGDITSNMVVAISGNFNTGNISGNFCVNISQNSNDGGILNNRVNMINLNSNAGLIANNTNLGNISSNENSGDIFRNRNSGDISENSSSVENIQYNVNNGSIHMSVTVGDITDTIVNK